MREGTVGLFALVVCGLLLSTSAGAAVSEEARCTIVKLKASVKELKDKAQCYERSYKAGVPVSSACLDRAESKRERLYSRAEDRGGCKTTKDGASLGTRVDSFLQDATRALEGRTIAAPAKPSPKPSPKAGGVKGEPAAENSDEAKGASAEEPEASEANKPGEKE